MDVKETRAYIYAKKCSRDKSGEVGRYVKKQALAWVKIADGKDKNSYVSEKEITRLYSLLKVIVHPDLGVSMYEGLEDYSMLFLTAVFCTLKNDGERRYTTALMEIARKNHKTFVSAVDFAFSILLYTSSR